MSTAAATMKSTPRRTTSEVLKDAWARDAQQRSTPERLIVESHEVIGIPNGQRHRDGTPEMDWQILFYYADGTIKLVRSVSQFFLSWTTISHPND